MFNPGFNKTPPARFGAGSTCEGAPAPIFFLLSARGQFTTTGISGES